MSASTDVAFPVRHGCEVSLHGGVAVALRDLRVATCSVRLFLVAAALAGNFIAAAFVGLLPDDSAAGRGSAAAFAVPGTGAGFSAIVADVLEVLLAIAFTPLIDGW
jgi:hypothetical protein